MGKPKETIRMGRPPLPKGQVKDTLIVVRLTPAFHKALNAAAQKAGKKLTRYVRDVLADKLEQER
jgi:predicted HicB family RNase H-like nuclease